MSCNYCWPGNCCGGPNCLSKKPSAAPDIDIVLNLHSWARVLDIPSGRFVNEDLEAAADHIAALRAERDEARRKCSDEIERNIEANNRMIGLREALDRLIVCADNASWVANTSIMDEVIEASRAALTAAHPPAPLSPAPPAKPE